MKKTLLSILRCLDCGKADWDLQIKLEDTREVREGTLLCRSCRKSHEIAGGILDIMDSLTEEVAHEKDHAESFGYLVLESGEKHKINGQTINRFKDLFLSLPVGDGSGLFR